MSKRTEFFILNLCLSLYINFYIDNLKICNSIKDLFNQDSMEDLVYKAKINMGSMRN